MALVSSERTCCPGSRIEERLARLDPKLRGDIWLVRERKATRAESAPRQREDGNRPTAADAGRLLESRAHRSVFRPKSSIAVG
jgi:hypothetical protein